MVDGEEMRNAARRRNNKKAKKSLTRKMGYYIFTRADRPVGQISGPEQFAEKKQTFSVDVAHPSKERKRFREKLNRGLYSFGSDRPVGQ